MPDGAAWPAAADGVLRGLAHELSNRTGTIAAVAEALAAERPDSRLATALSSEAERLQELLRLLRLLSTDATRPAEPVRPADVLDDALALFALHPGGRAASAQLAGALDEAPPVRARVPALTRALLVLLAAVADGGGPVGVCATSDDAWLVLRVAGEGVPPDEADWADAVAEARALVAADGGEVARSADGEGVELRLPTLVALRRAERERIG
ncbi:MAG TPA: hypothetical protein VFS08_03805 [Gemmatimonadaceae bacterium]|nr:hypothetical protein [Gemmatimonadaceae bacterium]